MACPYGYMPPNNSIELPVAAKYQCSPLLFPDNHTCTVDTPWACFQFDHPSDPDPANDICMSGCGLTALSMALNFASQAFSLPSGPSNPGALNQRFIEICLLDFPSCPYPVGVQWFEVATYAVLADTLSPYKFVGYNQSFDTDTALALPSHACRDLEL